MQKYLEDQVREKSETVFERSLQLFKSDIKKNRREREREIHEILKHKQMV